MYAIYYQRSRNKGFVDTPLLDEIYSLKQRAAIHTRSIKVLYLSPTEVKRLSDELKAVEATSFIAPMEQGKIKTSKEILAFLNNLFNDLENISKRIGVPIEVETPLPEAFALDQGVQNADMTCLNAREREIMTARKKDAPETLESLGQRFGVTRERIRQIEVQATEKLQKALKSIPNDDLVDKVA